ncbi:MAG: hypothetical protein N3E37_03105 [Candidatus Micrarchaeota archaeon]|nr:hypothetical protein [Candidatus Micrarchaeota archaeon]
MITVRIKDIKGFKEALTSISNIVDEGIFKFESEQVSLRAMDSSQISMVYFVASKKDFLLYDVSQPINVGLKITDLVNIFSRAVSEKAEEVSIEKSDNKVLITLFFADKKSRFELPILELSQSVTGDPKVSENAKVVILASAIKNALKNAELVSTYISFITTKESFVIESKGEVSTFSVEFSKKSSELSELVVKDDKIRATYPLQYLSDIMNGASDSATTTIIYNTFGVLKISYEIPVGSITFFLAPIRED